MLHFSFPLRTQRQRAHFSQTACTEIGLWASCRAYLASAPRLCLTVRVRASRALRLGAVKRKSRDIAAPRCWPRPRQHDACVFDAPGAALTTSGPDQLWSALCVQCSTFTAVWFPRGNQEGGRNNQKVVKYQKLWYFLQKLWYFLPLFQLSKTCQITSEIRRSRSHTGPLPCSRVALPGAGTIGAQFKKHGRDGQQ